MAISTNLLLKHLSGQLGKQLVIKQYTDKTVVAKYPDMSSRKLSKKQRQMALMMEDANDNVRTIMASEATRNAAQVRLNVTRNKLYHALIREYFKTQPRPEVPELKKGKKK